MSILIARTWFSRSLICFPISSRNPRLDSTDWLLIRIFFSRFSTSRCIASRFAILSRMSLTRILLSFSSISSYLPRIFSNAPCCLLERSSIFSSSLSVSIFSRRETTSTCASDKTNLLINSFTLSIGLKARDFGIISKNLSSKFPRRRLNRSCAAFFWSIYEIFLFFARNSSASAARSPAMKERSSSLHSSIYHLVVTGLSSSLESICTPSTK